MMSAAIAILIKALKPDLSLELINQIAEKVAILGATVSDPIRLHAEINLQVAKAMDAVIS